MTTRGARRERLSVIDTTLQRAAWGICGVLIAGIAIAVWLSVAGGAATADASAPVASSTDYAFGVVVLSFPLVGVLIVRLHPRNTMGWLLLAIGLIWGLAGLADGYARYGLVVNPGSLPAPQVAAALAAVSWPSGIGLMGTFLILLFPDGHLPSPRWRHVARLCGMVIIAITIVIALSPGPLETGPVPTVENPWGLESARSALAGLVPIIIPLLPLCVLACATSLVRRFRRSSGVERLQLKWFASAGALVALLFLLSIAGSLLKSAPFSGRDPEWLSVVQTMASLSFVLLPIAIGIAVLRHRLYDIDVVINRALVYSALTVTLGTTYLTMVLGLQGLLRPLTDQSDLAVAASTLAVAALFGPARRWIQAVVDRRFYRNRYDAARTLDAFVSQLRHELDLDAVGDGLSAAVRETVQPAHVSLWMRSTS